jgi:hypothetical protein
MSRTDRHRPYRVQLADPVERNRKRTSDGAEHLLHNTCACVTCSWWRAPERRRRRRMLSRDLAERIRDASEG